MLVAKLDFLQYIAVRSFSNNVGARLKTWWRSKVTGQESSHGEHKNNKPKQDVIQKKEKKVQPLGGRMPNAAGEESEDSLIMQRQKTLALRKQPTYILLANFLPGYC